MQRSITLSLPVPAALSALLLSSLAGLRAQETVDQRLDRIERENRELRTRLDRLSPPAGTGSPADHGTALPPGFRKAPATDEGVSIAGYGEYLYTQNSGRTDVADALRTVLYVGYTFDDRWLFHAEVEFEHGSTSTQSGTTSEGGEVSLEFGYLEYTVCDELSLRGGLVLVPVGLVNEQHEPTLFLPATRAETEQRIIPTTWRQMGFEALASRGDTEARLFVGTGLDGEEFSAAGLRSGRQKGNREAADDVAVALRLDHRCCPQLTFGGSVYYQQAGQDGLRGATAIPELDTVIAEAHCDWRPGAWIVRGLYASAWSDDALEFATATGRNLAERMEGYYAEVGHDLAPWWFPTSAAAVIPFVRYEHIDTQASMPEGIAADPTRDNRILTCGVHVRPTDRIVFKLDFEDWRNGHDRFHLGMGYVF